MKELQQLLALIKHVLVGEALPEKMDWKRMRTLAYHHHLEGFLYYAVRERDDVDEKIKAECQKKHMIFVAQQLGQNAASSQIFGDLAARGIRYMPLKATWFRPLYPTSDLRFSSDVDFYFDPLHKEEVKHIMQEAGFELKLEYVQNFIYTKGILTIEPHFAIAESERDVAYFGDVWERATSQDGILYTFSDEDIYIYHLLHTYKHMLEGGAGVRSVIDTWLWNRNKPHMDRAYLETEYVKLGISRFASALERLSRVWFDGEESDADMDCLGTFILQGGTYGTKEQQAQMDFLEDDDERALERAKRKYLWQRLFPSYKEMRWRYPAINKCPLLLPFFWLFRLLKILFTRKNKKIGTTLSVAQGMDRDAAKRASRVKKIIGA